MARAALVVLLSAVLALTLPAARADARQPDRLTAIDTALLEVRIGDAATGLVPAYRSADSVLVPLRDVLTIAGIDAPRSARPLVTASELARQLHADVIVDWSALVLLVADSGTLPVSRRAARARARAMLRAQRPTAVTAPLVRPARTPSALALDYAASRTGGVELAIGTRAIGGTVDVDVAGLAARVGNTLRVGWESLAPALPADSRALRWRIGTLDELGGGMGIRLTNGPVLLPDSIGATVLAAAGAAGSDVDVYLDGALVATDTLDAGGAARLYAIEQPGEHDIRVITYAQDGSERLVSHRRLVVPDALLPARAVRYAVAIGTCTSHRCSRFAGSVSMAPTDRVTFGAGVRPRADGGRGPALSLDARLADALVLAAGVDPVTGARLALRRDGGDGSGIVLRSTGLPSRARVTSLSGAWRVARGATARAQLVHADSGWLASAGATLATGIGAVTPTATISTSLTGVPSVRWGGDALLIGGRLPTMAGALRRALVRVHADAGGASAGSLEWTTTLVLPASSRLALEGSVAWRGSAAARRPVVSVSLRRRLSAATVRMTAERGDFAPAADEGVSGAVVLDAARGRVTASADPLAGRAGVHGRVFVDRDGDGRYGRGDAPVPGVAIRIGGTAALTDLDGGFEVWDLAPYRRVVVEVDSLSIDGDWLTAPAPVSVQPTPHALAWIDVPLRPRTSGAGRVGSGE